jgi:tetratricopeptide (TPR) repeat protein
MLNLHEVLSKLEGKHLVEAGMDFRTLYSGLVNAYQFSPAAGALAARRVLALCQEIGDPLGEAISLQSLGYLAMRLSDLDQARQRLEAALALFQETGERLGEANTLRSLGDLAKRLGDLDQARQRLEDALALYQEIGARLGLAKTLRRLGLIA